MLLKLKETRNQIIYCELDKPIDINKYNKESP